jgi:F-type H+-transporting ATPase subunit epsilon
MSTKRFPLSIVTPERPTWEGEVDALVVPAQEGQLGILPGHAPLLAQLRPGTVIIRQGNEDPRLLAVSGGFVEVLSGRVSLFAETAEMAEEIDAERARQAVEKARAALKHGAEEKFDSTAVAALERALARLRAYELTARRRTPRNSSPPKTSA